MPRLLDVSSLDHDAQVQIGDMLMREMSGSRPPVVCAWLTTDAAMEELAIHIARHLVGPGVDGRSAFWRFYDPRVLALALTVLEDGQREALLGPIKEWQFVWAGHCWAISGPGIANDDEPHLFAWPKPEQWQRINRSEVATRVVERLPITVYERTAQWPQEIDRICGEAVSRYGMSDTDTLADYAWHCVRYGEAFERHPIILGACDALSRREVLWSDVLGQFTASEFEALEKKSYTNEKQRN